MTHFATVYEKYTICKNADKEISDLTGVLPRVLILSTYEEDDIHSFACSPITNPNVQLLADKISEVTGKKIISRDMSEKDKYELKHNRLASYFTDGNLRNELVQAEKTFLEKAGCSILEDFYFAFPVPNSSDRFGVLSVMTKGEENKKIAAKKDQITIALQKVFL